MKKSSNNNRKLTKIKDEEWKLIDDTDGLYAISNYGRVKSFVRDREKGRIMKPSYVKNFACVNLKRNNKYRSFLVLAWPPINRTFV